MTVNTFGTTPVRIYGNNPARVSIFIVNLGTSSVARNRQPFVPHPAP